MANIISSQEYRNEETVAEKLSARDFTVMLSPVFEIDGEEYQVVLDGHHSYEAALQAGVDAEFEVQSVRDNDTIQMLVDGNIEDFLATHRIDCDYYFLRTGKAVW